MGFVARKKGWIRYADVAEDMSMIHRSDVVAKKVGLDGVVAPGMWVASHVQDMSRIRKAEFSFKKPVYEGDFIEKRDNSFYCGENLVCEGNVVFGGSSNNFVSFPEEGIVYSQHFQKRTEAVEEYLDSIDFGGMRMNPEMLLMSFSASTLLGYAESKGLVGIHAYQSMGIYDVFDVRDVVVHVKEDKIGKRMCKFDLYWESLGDIVATGKSKVLPLSV